jgi:hypothetical protein
VMMWREGKIICRSGRFPSFALNPAGSLTAIPPAALTTLYRTLRTESCLVVTSRRRWLTQERWCQRSVRRAVGELQEEHLLGRARR